MSSESQDPTPKPGGHSMLERLRGMVSPTESEGAEQSDAAPEAPAPEATPVAQPVPAAGEDTPVAQPIPATGEVPLAQPVPAPPTEGTNEPPQATPATEAPPVPEAAPVAADVNLADTLDLPPIPIPENLPVVPCPVCQSDCKPGQTSCSDCGYVFPGGAPIPAAPSAGSEPQAAGAPPQAVPAAPTISVTLKNRYAILETMGEKLGVVRHKGKDLGLTGSGSTPIVIVQQTISTPEVAAPIEEAAVESDDLMIEDEDMDEEILPSFDDPDAMLAAGPPTEQIPKRPNWPNMAWEQNLLETLEHPGLPMIMDTFSEGTTETMVLEVPTGRSLWDAWDDPDATNADRYGWLAQLANIMRTVHQLGAMLEGIRPDIVVIDDQNQVRITDLSDLLPFPVPADAPVRGSLYTAPEILMTPDQVTGRADIYSFGALMYALQLGRELAEMDFDSPGNPKPYIPEYPDCHPTIGRLMTKTFRREVDARFPTDEASKEDDSGMSELIHTLETCARTLDRTHMEIGAWTTTGIVRTGNEDGFSLLHSVESRQDDISETALILLCDGMGGYEAGELAASMAMLELRRFLSKEPQFKSLAGESGFAEEMPNPEGNLTPPLDVEQMKELLRNALIHANKMVHTEAKSSPSRRGMGCTAEAVYLDGTHIVIGHIGDSRTYHFSEGNLTLLTRDQTLVNRLVELGQLTEEEAETHPRRNELQQALGGQPHVDPGVYSARLKAGDVIVVCSDGLTGHVNHSTLRQFLAGEGFSAEIIARRLVNLTNIKGATDNTTVVVIRAT